MSDDGDRTRAVLWLWFARGLGLGGLLLALQGITIALFAPGFLSLGLAVMVIALVIGLSAKRRVKKLREQAEECPGGGGERRGRPRRVHVGLWTLAGNDAAVGRAAPFPSVVRRP